MMSSRLCTSLVYQLDKMVSAYLKSDLCVLLIVRLHASKMMSKEKPYSSVHFLIYSNSTGAGLRPLMPNAFKMEKCILEKEEVSSFASSTVLIPLSDHASATDSM